MPAPNSTLEAHPLPAEPLKKTRPRASTSTFPHLSFSPSPTGVDTNLLILLHGAGDSAAPFHILATKRLQPILPQTATLTLQGQKRIPWLPPEETACCYWDVVDEVTGMPVEREDPRDFLKRWTGLLDHLVDECGWKPERIHVFGFAHGGSAGLEGAAVWSRERRRRWAEGKKKEDEEGSTAASSSPPRLGSLISVSGPLLSLPTFEGGPLATPVLYLSPPKSADADRHPRELRRAFANVERVALVGGEEDMPRMPSSKAEWDPIMLFWSKLLSQRSTLEMEGEVYQVKPSS